MDYVFLMVIAVLGIAFGLFVLREAKKYRTGRRDAEDLACDMNKHPERTK